MNELNNYLKVKQTIEDNQLKNKTELIVVTKNQNYQNIIDIINAGHLHFGENRIQEAEKKWKEFIFSNKNIQLHLLGKLQSNKVKNAIKLFDYIHSLDSQKLAEKLSEEEKKIGKKIKYFIQVNFDNETQKSGIEPDSVYKFVNYCSSILKLNIIGLMCIPPVDKDSELYFKKLSDLAKSCTLKELSMGMSNDYITAIRYDSTFVRIGKSIFKRI
jgi:pyridoxal phosphate enzyme (YggS family)